jgi:hypothetical protein
MHAHAHARTHARARAHAHTHTSGANSCDSVACVTREGRLAGRLSRGRPWRSRALLCASRGLGVTRCGRAAPGCGSVLHVGLLRLHNGPSTSPAPRTLYYMCIAAMCAGCMGAVTLQVHGHHARMRTRALVAPELQLLEPHNAPWGQLGPPFGQNFNSKLKFPTARKQKQTHPSVEPTRPDHLTCCPGMKQMRVRRH